MFWVTFFVSGLTIASIPWIASHFSNRIAGFLVLVPVMMAISIVVQYMAHGPKDTAAMIEATLYGLPTLLIFGLTALVLIKHNVSIPLVVMVSLVAWLVSVLILNHFLAR